MLSHLSNMIVVLVEPENLGNVGFTARVMANYGVKTLRVVGKDPRHNGQASKFAVHAKRILESAEIYSSLIDALGDTNAAWAATARYGGYRSVTRSVVPLTELPNPTMLNGKIALVFGRESYGLTNEEIALCDLAFTIPVSPMYNSLNLSHAVAVTLYHFFVNYSDSPNYEKLMSRAASRNEKEQVCLFFDEIVDMIPLRDFKKPIAKQVFRNLTGRAFMTGREIATLIGTLRKIRDELKMCEKS